MIYRNSFRKWTVEVSDDCSFAGDHYETFWRSTVRMGKPCELFTIAKEHNSDDALVQLLLFEDGNMQAWSWHPAMIQSSPEERSVVVGIHKPENSMLVEYMESS